jgi:hypothetical protein
LSLVVPNSIDGVVDEPVTRSEILAKLGSHVLRQFQAPEKVDNRGKTCVRERTSGLESVAPPSAS